MVRFVVGLVGAIVVIIVGGIIIGVTFLIGMMVVSIFSMFGGYEYDFDKQRVEIQNGILTIQTQRVEENYYWGYDYPMYYNNGYTENGYGSVFIESETLSKDTEVYKGGYTNNGKVMESDKIEITPVVPEKTENISNNTQPLNSEVKKIDEIEPIPMPSDRVNVDTGDAQANYVEENKNYNVLENDSDVNFSTEMYPRPNYKYDPYMYNEHMLVPTSYDVIVPIDNINNVKVEEKVHYGFDGYSYIVDETTNRYEVVSTQYIVYITTDDYALNERLIFNEDEYKEMNKFLDELYSKLD